MKAWGRKGKLHCPRHIVQKLPDEQTRKTGKEKWDNQGMEMIPPVRRSGATEGGLSSNGAKLIPWSNGIWPIEKGEEEPRNGRGKRKIRKGGGHLVWKNLNKTWRRKRQGLACH